MKHERLDAAIASQRLRKGRREETGETDAYRVMDEHRIEVAEIEVAMRVRGDVGDGELRMAVEAFEMMRRRLDVQPVVIVENEQPLALIGKARFGRSKRGSHGRGYTRLGRTRQHQVATTGFTIA